MRQPYIYTLPEAFIEDKSVPMRWKLYALINGFWIAGLEVFASNKFFAVKLKCSERHIQGCLEDLEKLGVVKRVVVGFDRRILPGTNPAFVGGRTAGSPGDEPSVHHNSYSNAESINTASEDAPRPREVIEVYEAPDTDGELGDSKSPRISGDKKKAYDELIAWSENERGFPFPKTTKLKQYRAFKLANQNSISRENLIERWEEMSTKKFWQENGYDWMNVVQDLLKKPV